MASDRPDQPDKSDSGVNDLAMIATAKRDAEAARRAQSGSGPASLPPAAWRGPEETAERAGSSEPAGSLGLPAGLSSDSFAGYEILHEIHRGGQGVVYQALQKSTRRKVALKVMREGPFATPSEQARFDREVRILGQLNHPNIVSIHDSGQSGGCHFFVMNYIGGQPLDVWMAGAEHPVEESLRLFAKVCEAVNAAHLRGITHRDLKPGNIRVDERGEPHILDFGLAKVALEGLEGGGPAMTLTGQFVGSLPWASPEQAEGSPAKIDLRTDVYSLGVILYQMLTGKFPYEVIGNMRDVLDRILRAEPIRPSTIRVASPRRHSVASPRRNGVASAPRGRRRGQVPNRIGDEVDTIVLKCLAKERERRYQSAGELARDIGHYLAGEPIEAKQDSTVYVLGKYLRKHRLPAAVGLGFVLVVTAGLVVSLTFWRQAVVERGSAEQARAVAEERRAAAEASAAEATAAAVRAKKERDKATHVSDFMERTLQGAGPAVARGRDTAMLREMMDAAAKRVEDGELRQAPEAELFLRVTIGRTYRELGVYDDAERVLRPAVELARVTYGGDHPEVATTLVELAFLLKVKGDLSSAELLYREALAMRRRLLGNEHPAVANSLNNLAVLLKNKGNLVEAKGLYREALEIRRKALGDEHPDVAMSMENLAVLLRVEGNFAEAGPLLRQALELRRRALGDEHPLIATSLNTLGLFFQAQGDYAAAEPLFREALALRRKLLGNEHPHVALALSNLASLLHDKGDYTAAEQLHREALDIHRKRPDDERLLAGILGDLAVTLQAQGKYAEAETLCREALARGRKLLGNEAPMVANNLANLARLLQQANGDYAAAELLLREAVAIRQKQLPPGHPRLVRTRTDLAQTLLKLAESESLSMEERKARLDEAEGLLLTVLKADTGAKPLPEPPMKSLSELYEARHALEPDQGYDQKAAEWQAKLAEWQASTQPASQPAAQLTTQPATAFP